jgi:N-acetylglutamate synthase-like GNAT family acetyltransferase
MDRSRLRAPGVEVGFVADPATLLEESAELYVVDLARTGVLEALGGRPGDGARLVGAAMAEARAAGLDEVYARSTFFRRFPEV